MQTFLPQHKKGDYRLTGDFRGIRRCSEHGTSVQHVHSCSQIDSPLWHRSCLSVANLRTQVRTSGAKQHARREMVQGGV